jgi:transcriptional regulator with XRE-family HTH domain
VVVYRLIRGRALHQKILTPNQLRAARALVGWSRDELAGKCGMAVETIQGFESRGSDPRLSTLSKWRYALEGAGVRFIEPDDDGGPGVRLMAEKKERAQKRGKRR